MNIYQQHLMDHYRFPRNQGLLKPADFMSHEHNPSCGDSVIVSGRLDAHGMITAIGFEGTGCVISIATASLLFEHCIGLSADTITRFDRNSIMQLIGIELGPTRLKCALLPLQAIQQGIQRCLIEQSYSKK